MGVEDYITRRTDPNDISFTPPMSLRDYFAAAALSGFASMHEYEGSSVTAAMEAYKWADAMIKQREKR